MPNYGLDLEKERRDISEKDWVYLGAAQSQRCIALIPQNLREVYLPQGEVQRGSEDFRDCASRGPINILETKFTYLLRNDLLDPANEKWLRDKGYVQGDRVLFSDRFIAIKSGTTKNGNSLIAPLQAINEWGLIPKSLFPAHKTLNFTAYHNPKYLTPAMEDLGEEFKEHFLINYERVLSRDFGTVIEEDMLDVGGFAWPFPKNGEYQKDTREPNHCFVFFKNPRHHIFDNYVEVGSKDDYIKKLAPDYFLMDYGYRIFITENPQEEIHNLLLQVLELCKELYARLKTKVGSWNGLSSPLYS